MGGGEKKHRKPNKNENKKNGKMRVRVNRSAAVAYATVTNLGAVHLRPPRSSLFTRDIIEYNLYI